MLHRSQDETALMAVAGTLPLIAIQGELDQHLIAHKVQQYLKEHFPRSEFRLLPGVGHAPFFEAPEVTIGIILEFVKRHSG